MNPISRMIQAKEDQNSSDARDFFQRVCRNENEMGQSVSIVTLACHSFIKL